MTLQEVARQSRQIFQVTSRVHYTSLKHSTPTIVQGNRNIQLDIPCKGCHIVTEKRIDPQLDNQR